MHVYVIHSTVGTVHTRLKRKISTLPHKPVQRIGGGDIILRRVRPVTVGEAVITKHLAELTQRWEAGMLEVRTTGGEVVDLKNLGSKPKPKPSAKPAPKPEPLPPEPAPVEDKFFTLDMGDEGEKKKSRRKKK
jgi:hypothetical protein